ncbi:MAG: GTP-binding protein [Haliscomenobacter sp.]|uniref:GTP-binding protein n=1 Tax=Haliscomenobacter sp. TaxID=2717303 RepID=UPI0029A1BC15|nr:GTP-binding protein [Haliscomenobacter sp.]MDX2070207.1 GTP-binding protein [Haliscomenobacter sp.]
MKIHLLSGFLGSGKTTAIHQAARQLIQAGQKIGVITNDQGMILVDHGLFKNQDIPSRQVINGCFCCNYQDLDNNIQALLEEYQAEVIFAESVGSCTDIVATVLKPLLLYRPDAVVSLSTFADVRLLQLVLKDAVSFDETILYIFKKQLEEAKIIVVNKIDLISAEVLQNVQQLIQEKYGDKIVLYQNTFDPESLKNWLETIDADSRAAKLESLQIDYDTYAQGEARLAWLDQSMEVTGENALQGTEYLINEIYHKTVAQGYNIGHLKFLIDGETKVSFTNNTQVEAQLNILPKSSVNLLLNMRVESTPEEIQHLIREACKTIENQYDYKLLLHQEAAFQPGYPKPVFRMS